MKAMFFAFVMIGVIALAANWGLNQAGFSAAEQGSSPNVRLD